MSDRIQAIEDAMKMQLDEVKKYRAEGEALHKAGKHQESIDTLAKAGSMERYHQMEAINFAATEVHKQLGALFNPKMTPEMREVQMGVIERRFNPLEKSLAGKQFIMGDKFTVADAYLFNVLNWTNPLKIDLAKWPNIQAYMGRVGARPKVQETLKAEGLVK